MLDLRVKRCEKDSTKQGEKQMSVDRTIADVLYGIKLTNPGLNAFMQSVARGRMDKFEAFAILEHSPRLAEMLMQGLGGIYSETITPTVFVKLADRGQINGGVLSRAVT